MIPIKEHLFPKGELPLRRRRIMANRRPYLANRNQRPRAPEYTGTRNAAQELKTCRKRQMPASVCQRRSRLSWRHMKNTRKRRGDVSRGLQEWQLKTLVVMPLASRINKHSVASLRLSRRILKQLREVEDSIEIIARQIARQLRWGK